MSKEIDNPTVTSLVTAKRTQIEIILEHLLLRIETRIGETRTRPINYNLRMGYKVPACNPLHEASNPPGVHSRGKSSTTSGSTNEQEDGTAGTSHLTHPRATAKIRKPHLPPSHPTDTAQRASMLWGVHTINDSYATHSSFAF